MHSFVTSVRLQYRTYVRILERPRNLPGDRGDREQQHTDMGQNADIKRYSTATLGQPIELFDSKRGRLPVILELLASPWIVRASDLKLTDGSCAAKHAEEDVEVVWDAERCYPLSFTREARVYRIDAVVQIWAAERAWWNPLRRVSRRFWRVLARGGVYDLAYDRELGTWRLIGIQD
jgi:hypothetical protein